MLGALVLAAMFRRCEPWHMCYIPLHSGPESFVEFRHVLFTGHLRIPWEYFIVLSLVVLPAVACLFRGAREAVAALFKNKPALWAASLTLLCFLISFFSGFFLEEKRYPAPLFVRSAALYLTLGLYGIVFFFIGISAYIIDLNVWRRLRDFVFASPLPWFLMAVFLTEFILTNMVSLFAFDHIPHIQDSVAQVFHGKIFRRRSPDSPVSAALRFFLLR